MKGQDDGRRVALMLDGFMSGRMSGKRSIFEAMRSPTSD